MLDAIFGSPDDRVLYEILQDQVHGTHTLSKILCGQGMIDETRKPVLLEATKRVLTNMKMTSAFSYRRLLEECGMPTPAPLHTPGRFNNGSRSPNASAQGSPYRSGTPNSSTSPYAQQNYRFQGQPPAFLQQPAQPLQNPYASGGFQPSNIHSVQDLAMNQMVSSMQAFQLGQGMAANGGLSPLNIPGMGGMVGSPVMGGMTPTPTMGSFATPHAQLMSPNSDPFNPVSAS